MKINPLTTTTLPKKQLLKLKSKEQDSTKRNNSMDIKDNYNPPHYQSTVTFKGTPLVPAIYPGELTSLLPEQVQNKLPSFIPAELITNKEGELNPLGKEVIASVEGKLCQLGQKDPKSINYYLFKGSDFDGTLSLLVPKADDAKPIGPVIDHLVDLSFLPNVHPGIITGRDIKSLSERLEKSDSPKYKPNQVKDKLFISGLHGLQKLENNKIKANISPQQKKVLKTIRSSIQEYKAATPYNKNKITLFEDKECAYAFHFDTSSDDYNRMQAVTQALNIIKDSNAVVIMPDENKCPKEKELAHLIIQNGVQTVDNINDTNKGSVFKLIYGSGVLEIIPPGSNKGTVFTDLFNSYKESIVDKLEENPNAKIIAAYSGDDTTDFDTFKAIVQLSNANVRVEPDAVLVVNNRKPDLSGKIAELDGELIKVDILDNVSFLEGQNKLLSEIEKYYR